MSKSLNDMWLEYRACMSPGAGPVQVKETRRAFYAGAFAIQRLMIGASTAEGTSAVSELSGWVAEVEVFRHDVLAGKA